MVELGFISKERVGDDSSTATEEYGKNGMSIMPHLADFFKEYQAYVQRKE
jgi:hypothetical protein